MPLRYLTAGESHGRGLSGILEGMPSGLPCDVAYIHRELKRRKLGYGRGARQKLEDDAVEILTGVRHGYTLGSPICLLVMNKDWRNWETIMSVSPLPEGTEVKRKVAIPRPGHADLVGGIKYDHSDMRNVLERSSARETTIRVAIATVARRFLEELGIHVASRVVRVGATFDPTPFTGHVGELNALVDESPLRVLGKDSEKSMVAQVEQCKKDGDTLGGVFEVFASGVPVGLGSYAQWDRRIEGKIGQQFLSLNAIKGVEVGLGFGAAVVQGSSAHDELEPGKYTGRPRYLTNRSGGIDGGMTTGQPIVVRAAMKPISTLMQPLRSVDLATNQPASAHIERSDICAVPAAAVIGESLLALVVAEEILEKFGGDSMGELKTRFEAWHSATRSE